MGTQHSAVPFYLAATGVAAACLLTACGGGIVRTGSGGPDQAQFNAQRIALLAAAPDATLAKGTATVSETDITAGLGGSGQQGPDTTTSLGSYDFATNQAQIDQMDNGQDEGTTIWDNGVLYLKDPVPGTPGAPPWIKFDTNALSQRSGDAGMFGEMMGATSGLVGSDAQLNLSLLKAVTGTVGDLGREALGGALTTHYRFGVDSATVMAEVLQRMPPSVRSEMAPGESQMIATTSFTGEVWLDDQGVVRKLHILEHDTPGADPTPTPTGLFSGDGTPSTDDTTLVFSNFGAPVTLTIPPASEVTDSSQMSQQLGNLQNLFGASGGSGNG